MEGIEGMEIDRKYKEDIFNKPLNELELSYKSANGLRKDNIKYLGDLVKLSKPEIMRIPFIGKKSLNEIVEVLNEISLRLDMKPEETTEEDKYLDILANMPKGIETVYIRNAIDKINSRLENIENVLNFYNPTNRKEDK
jgi:ERCC4-type nuclease